MTNLYRKAIANIPTVGKVVQLISDLRAEGVPLNHICFRPQDNGQWMLEYLFAGYGQR